MAFRLVQRESIQGKGIRYFVDCGVLAGKLVRLLVYHVQLGTRRKVEELFPMLAIADKAEELFPMLAIADKAIEIHEGNTLVRLGKELSEDQAENWRKILQSEYAKFMSDHQTVGGNDIANTRP